MQKGRKKIEKDIRKHGKSDKVIERQGNLAEALRANLRRRKEQKINILKIFKIKPFTLLNIISFLKIRLK